MYRYLLGLDFDGTMALTYEPSPHGIGVNQAYEMSVFDLFGEEGLNKYHEIGGHRSRSPLEIVNLISAHGVNSQQDRAEKLVKRKLHYLLGEIGLKNADGSIWPRPTPGFIEFWNTIPIINCGQKDFKIDTAVISSGHIDFILETLDVWGISHPDFLVTEDDVRNRKHPELERRVKPGTLPLALAHKSWLTHQGIAVTKENMPFIVQSKSRIVYFGDDPKKDAGMAQRGRVNFGLFGSDFTDWETVEYQLLQNSRMLREGKAFTEIFNKSSHKERF